MKVSQIYSIVNDVTKETIGESAVVNEDLSNIVDVGTAVADAEAVDNYVKKLVDHIGRVVFVDRPYAGGAPSVLMDGWEYGSVLEKIRAELPDATENESWALENGTSYDVNVFTKPNVSAKFYNQKVTFEVPMSFTEMQVKESFSNAAQLNGFMSMIYNEIEKTMTIKIDGLIGRTINNMIGETLHAEYPDANYTATSGVRAVNLLKLYNDRFGGDSPLTVDKALFTPEFIRFAVFTMGLYEQRIGKISKLFNIGGAARFTPSDMLHFVLLSDFASASNVYLQSDTFHNEFTALPRADVVPYWQGSGKGYDFASVSSIDIKTASNNAVKASGIIGVMFDRDALGVTNMNRRVTSNYNGKAEFYNNWYKMDAGYFNDSDENFVVFFIA